MRVLLAIDEFSPSNEAVMEVKNRSWPANTTVLVLHVVEKFVPPAQALWFDGGGDPTSIKEQAKQNAEELVAAAAESLGNTGLRIERLVQFGDPAKVIVNVGKEWNADLIIIGSHRYTGLRRLLSGHVGRSVLSHAPCSIEVAHNKGVRR